MMWVAFAAVLWLGFTLGMTCMAMLVTASHRDDVTP